MTLTNVMSIFEQVSLSLRGDRSPDRAAVERDLKSDLNPDNPLVGRLGKTTRNLSTDLRVLSLLSEWAQERGSVGLKARHVLGALAERLAKVDDGLATLVERHCRDELKRHGGAWLLENSNNVIYSKTRTDWERLAARLGVFELVYIRARLISSTQVANNLALTVGKTAGQDVSRLVMGKDFAALARSLRGPTVGESTERTDSNQNKISLDPLDEAPGEASESLDWPDERDEYIELTPHFETRQFQTAKIGEQLAAPKLDLNRKHSSQTRTAPDQGEKTRVTERSEQQPEPVESQVKDGGKGKTTGKNYAQIAWSWLLRRLGIRS